MKNLNTTTKAQLATVQVFPRSSPATEIRKSRKPLTHAFSGFRLICLAGESQRLLMKAENLEKFETGKPNQRFLRMQPGNADAGDGTNQRKLAGGRRASGHRPWLVTMVAPRPRRRQRSAGRRNHSPAQGLAMPQVPATRADMVAAQPCPPANSTPWRVRPGTVSRCTPGYRRAAARPATNVIFAKRTQIKLSCKYLNMRILINNFRFSKRAKRTQTKPSCAGVDPAGLWGRRFAQTGETFPQNSRSEPLNRLTTKARRPPLVSGSGRQTGRPASIAARNGRCQEWLYDVELMCSQTHAAQPAKLW